LAFNVAIRLKDERARRIEQELLILQLRRIAL